jgi:ABC-2 type transport system permease protein
MNPCFYLVDGVRRGFFGGSTVAPGRSLALALVGAVVTSTLAIALLARGYKIRT